MYFINKNGLVSKYLYNQDVTLAKILLHKVLDSSLCGINIRICDSLGQKLETSNKIFLKLVYKKLISTLKPKFFRNSWNRVIEYS